MSISASEARKTLFPLIEGINILVDACLRDSFSGIGKPGQLKDGARRVTRLWSSPKPV